MEGNVCNVGLPSQCHLHHENSEIRPYTNTISYTLPETNSSHLSVSHIMGMIIAIPFEEKSCHHRENGGTLGMVPLINPIYTPYIVGIYWVYPPFKGLQQGGENLWCHQPQPGWTPLPLSTSSFARRSSGAGEAGFSWEGGGKIDDRKGHSKTLCLTLRVSFARFAILKCGECKATWKKCH